MAVQDEAGTNAIELNFCQKCGISIPLVDIEAGRARAAPGGYVCVGCIYQQREDDIQPRSSARYHRPSPRGSGGGRALTAIALLYVVGASTFLLYKELSREPVEVDVRHLAARRDVEVLAGKTEGIDQKSARAFAQLFQNDGLHRQDLAHLGEAVRKLEERVAAESAEAKKTYEDLAASVLDVTRRTIGLDKDAKDILSELRGLKETVKRQPVPVAPPPTDREPEPVVPKETEPKESDAAVADPELTRKIEKYVAQLKDKGVDKQMRFNAAVELGELNDPRAVDPLMDALSKDPYYLVRQAAAYYLGTLGKHSVRAIPNLIGQMDDKEAHVAYQCERALGLITQATLGAPQTFHLDPTMDRKKRRSIQKKWEDWWEKMKPKLLPEGA
ncbi:MAG: HEAT repeat domain-containing protein [Planctomycetota bacterium]|jgi:hypothetical protein